MAGKKSVLTEKEGPIAWLVLNRPEKLNVLNTALFKELHEAIQQLDSDPTVRVVATGRWFTTGGSATTF